MADTPKVYVLCDANCKWEGMTKEQILTAIMQAVQNGEITDVDTGFVSTIRTINGTGLKFFVGEQHEYEALTAEQKEGLFAIITNDTTKEGFASALEECWRTLEGHESTLANLDHKITVNGEMIGFFSQWYFETIEGEGYVPRANKATAAQTAETLNLGTPITIEYAGLGTYNGTYPICNEIEYNSCYLVEVRGASGTQVITNLVLNTVGDSTNSNYMPSTVGCDYNSSMYLYRCRLTYSSGNKHLFLERLNLQATNDADRCFKTLEEPAKLTFRKIATIST